MPENWLPIVAAPSDPDTGGFVLERRPFLRFDEDGQPQAVSPLGTMLLTDPACDRLRIAEQQLPREGVVVIRSFQLARTEGRGRPLWIGRRAQVGRSEGASGLQLDSALPPGAT